MHSQSSPPRIDPASAPVPAVGGAVEVSDALEIATWSALVHHVGGDIIRVSGETPPPGVLGVRAAVQVSYPDERSLVVLRGRILERTSPMLRIALFGPGRRVQRRGAPRGLCWQTVDVEVAAAGTRRAHSIPAALVDISSSGCGLRADASFIAGDHVTFAADLGSAALALSGRVVRTWQEGRSHGAGVALALPPAVRAVIDRYVCAQRIEGVDAVPRFRSV